jgi:hypothetical protein
MRLLPPRRIGLGMSLLAAAAPFSRLRRLACMAISRL